MSRRSAKKVDESLAVEKASPSQVEELAADKDRSSASDESSSGRKDSKIWGNIESMNVITKSPYEPPFASAEVGESAFDEVKKLLVAADGNGAYHPQAARLFGVTLAESVVVASYQIGKSGMLYSPGWQEGKIRGVQCGWIPKRVLLLCLHEQRFVRTSDALLAGIIRDLGVTKIVGEAIDNWNLDRRFLNLSSNTTYTYMKSKLACYKCEIFVARAFHSIKICKRENIEPSLWRKVLDCLEIMNEHVRVNKNGIAKRLSELEEDETPPTKVVKKKTVKRKKESESDKDNKRRRKEIDALVGMFEQQAKRMQDLLEVLKTKMKEERDEMASEIREEVRVELMGEQDHNNRKKRK
jgi:DNA-binding transcriptional regulator YhcF (GntR family)